MGAVGHCMGGGVVHWGVCGGVHPTARPGRPCSMALIARSWVTGTIDTVRVRYMENIHTHH